MAADDGAPESLSGQMDNLPPEIQKFFKQFGGGQFGGGLRLRRIIRSMLAQGSGFFISADGYIVTNNHVVQARQVRHRDDGRRQDA